MGTNRRKAVRMRKKRRILVRKEFAKKCAERLMGNPVRFHKDQEQLLWHFGTNLPGEEK